MVPVRDQKYRSCFKSFFVKEEGVISISLKGLTLVGSLLVTFGLLSMLYIACKKGEVTCNWDKPDISHVVFLHPYDRIWCLLTTFFTMAVLQVNIRAYYKWLHGKISEKRNDFLLGTGVVFCFALPAVAFFDYKMLPNFHIVLACLFFGGCILYNVLLSHYLWNNREKFDKRYHTSFKVMWWTGWGLIFSVTVLEIVSKYLHMTHAKHNYGATVEWILGLGCLNFFTVSAFANPFYDTVHAPEKE